MQMKRKCTGFILGAVLFMAAVLLSRIMVSADMKKTIYNSPYVEFSPDGKAWTTCAGDMSVEWYPQWMKEDTGISSSLRNLQKGEHYYKERRDGEVPVGCWKVEHRTAHCVHDDYPGTENFHGVTFGRQNCLKPYFSGWRAYCADCGDLIEQEYIYMSREAAKSIQYLDLGKKEEKRAYYYLCPYCNNLEQGAPLTEHWCSDISWNQYRIVYDANVDRQEKVYGYMQDSLHLYNNATKYEGEEVTPITTLTACNYRRTGYIFAGWNTEPDGTGEDYRDGAEILNLSGVDWQDSDTWTETDNGKVILYAQWRTGSSTLEIDGNGGRYNGCDIYEKKDFYGKYYDIEAELIEVPDGNTLSFEVNGGTEIPPLTGTMYFTGWMLDHPFEGKLQDNRYSYTASDGHVDRIRACYAAAPVILPETQKNGWSFGGWYYDREYRQPAGGVGDRIIPDRNMTLYAQWVDLRLQSVDNYSENEGKGAVDLKWSQSDDSNKTYLVYQKKENGPWIRVNSANDISSVLNVEQVYTYSGTGGQYTVPYTGLYTLTAQGAQGKSYGSYAGGYGGKVTGNFWLKQGEVLTYNIGGQNGYNGGGNATLFGNGGGMTSVISDQKGILLIAGGGGGAYSHGNGEPGGSNTNVVSGSNGQQGMAGGGAGYQGGTAGERTVHRHTADCAVSRSILSSFKDSSYFYEDANEDNWSVGRKSAEKVPVEGFSTLHFSGYLWQLRGHQIRENGGELKVYNQKGLIFYRQLGDVERYVKNEYRRAKTGNTEGTNDASVNIAANYDFDEDGTAVYQDTNYMWLHYNPDGTISKWAREHMTSYSPTPIPNALNFFVPAKTRSGSQWFYENYWYFKYDIPIPEGSTSLNIEFSITHENRDRRRVNISEATLTGKKGCGMEEGQVLSSCPAYGGSSYVNQEYAHWYRQDVGARSGNGMFELQSRMIGYQDVLQLSGVTATDTAAPDKISDKVKTEVLNPDTVCITWREPEDAGTDYYHKVESYLRGSDSILCRSNITKNTLTSGIKGYHYVVDYEPDTVVTISNAFTKDPFAKAVVGRRNRYLHVAAVDIAENVGKTTHIPICADKIPWKIYTKQLAIDAEENNICQAEMEKTWYVRADGVTPFVLKNEVRLEGVATMEYQPDMNIYETCPANGTISQNRIYTPPAGITEENVRTDASGLTYSVTGQAVLQRYPYSYSIRSDYNRELFNVQKFVLSPDYSGQMITVIPRGGIEKADVFTAAEEDRKNGIFLIGDGEGPVIWGLEALGNVSLLDRGKETVTVTVTASDAISGIKDFYVTIENKDNTVRKVFTPMPDGNICIEITEEEPVFSGDFTVTGYAVDNVGNETVISYGTTEFALESSVLRIQEPREPVFRRGESGVVTFTVWGYAERVEIIFPEEMTMLDPSLNREYDYQEKTGYKITEQLQFMVPLYTPENNNFQIIVRAYKGDRKLEDHPAISVIAVQGSVLEDFHTRLR